MTHIRLLAGVITVATGGAILASGTTASANAVETLAWHHTWGNNVDGWEVSVENAFDRDFTLALGYAVDAQPTLGAYSTDANIKGEPSWFGGPADMRINYWDSAHDSRTYRYVDIESTFFSNELTVRCGIARSQAWSSGESDGAGCSVLKADRTGKISVRFGPND